MINTEEIMVKEMEKIGKKKEDKSKKL